MTFTLPLKLYEMIEHAHESGFTSALSWTRLAIAIPRQKQLMQRANVQKKLIPMRAIREHEHEQIYKRHNSPTPTPVGMSLSTMMS